MPSLLVPDLIVAILSHHHSNSFFKQQSVLLLEIDGKCLYYSQASSLTSVFKEVYKGWPYANNTVHLQKSMKPSHNLHNNLFEYLAI